MDPVSIIGLVTGIVSAFTGAVSLFKSFKNKPKTAAAAEQSLAIGKPEVQDAYNRGFQQYGERFAKGDDVGHGQLTGIIIDLQTKVIGTLSALLKNNGAGSYDSLFAASESSRQGAVGALTSQFQRIAQAAPVAASLPAAEPSWTRVPKDQWRSVLWPDTDRCYDVTRHVNYQVLGFVGNGEKLVSCVKLTSGNDKEIQRASLRRGRWGWNPKTNSYVTSPVFKAIVDVPCCCWDEEGTQFSVAAGRLCDVHNDTKGSAREVWIRFTPDGTGYRIKHSNISMVQTAAL